MNLHLKVDPEKFCCNDGTCIDSQLVCDKIAHCDESEDETKDLCKIITFDELNYRPDEAPVDIKNIHGEIVSSPSKINMSVSIHEFISLDINEAHFTIIFRFIIFSLYELYFKN